MDGLVSTHHTRLAGTRVSGDNPSQGEKGGLATERHLIALTVPEVRRLFGLALRQVVGRAFVLAWSEWRRRHQFRARQCHYRRRENRYAT